MLPRRLPQALASTIVLLVIAARRADAVPSCDQTDPRADAIDYRIERTTVDGRDLVSRFGGPELALLEKLNRADLAHLKRLPNVIVPSVWLGELDYSPFPATYPAANATPQLIVVDQPAQAFAAYEYGRLVRWGPISSGRKAKPTPSGLYHLNWRARTRTSTLSGEWRLNWYFNFHNARGLAFHEFELPGVPMSHACVRLLARDAEWVFRWGTGWTLDAKGQLATRGTPVIIQGNYAFNAPPPWLTADGARPIELPKEVPIPPVSP
jgi:hypothetical protein